MAGGIRQLAPTGTYPTHCLHGARQIGNAVPPPLAKVIAGEVMKALRIRPIRPHGVLRLGDTALLSLDLSGAAKYFGVDAPPSRRDKKSGAKKRKQADIERQRLVDYG